MFPSRGNTRRNTLRLSSYGAFDFQIARGQVSGKILQKYAVFSFFLHKICPQNGLNSYYLITCTPFLGGSIWLDNVLHGDFLITLKPSNVKNWFFFQLFTLKIRFLWSWRYLKTLKYFFKFRKDCFKRKFCQKLKNFL